MPSSPSTSFCSPSSSAVTILVPGKSILKRPPPAQQSLFSRITRFLPTQNQPQNANDETKPLKRAHFILPHIATVYPISSVNPPSTPTLKDEKRNIEDREADRRRRVVRGNSMSSVSGDTEEWWNMDKVESFYRECCAGCDEDPDPAISRALKQASSSSPRTVDFSGAQLTITSASVLSDVFTIEWGLRKVIFRECDLDDLSLKPMLHALLIPNTLSFLSVASNRRLRAPAFRLIGAYLANAKSIQFLDLSQNNLDKKSVEYVVAALTTAPEPGLISLRMDDCQLRPAGIEVLSRAVRTSSLRNISLRHNRISPGSGVALALMIRDYPDVVPQGTTPANSTPASLNTSPSSSVSHLPIMSPPGTPTTISPSPSFNLPPPPRTGPVLPPPRHPVPSLQTTYTPYVPRSRRGRGGPINTANTNPLSPTGQPIPIITSSSTGGVTTRHPVVVNGHHPHSNGDVNAPRHNTGPSAALLDKVRALDNLPRVGALRTLDLRGNDLRMGVTYIAQVLKRNRTLKVLNLSENKLDVQCLVAIAESLKYNSCLETLDLSRNPCSGPGLEGIQSLRTAFTLNTALKRLFLSSTSLSSTGAIALAEFLPESTSLLHLDLTSNNLDLAGVMALSGGLKANHTMRCLDLNIPPADEKYARYDLCSFYQLGLADHSFLCEFRICRDILNSCVRNTEEAERRAQAVARGLGKGVWGMIEESELAKSIRMGADLVESDVAVRARSCIAQLQNLIDAPPSRTPTIVSPITTSPQLQRIDDTRTEVIARAQSIASDLANVIQRVEDPVRMEELFEIHDQLMNLISKVPQPPPTPKVPFINKPMLALSGLGIDVSGVNGAGTSVTAYNATGVVELLSGSPEPQTSESGDEVTPTTPRVDKGKARAEPEPEVLEKVLSPTFMITEEESDEDGDGEPYIPVEEVEGALSPTNDRSRSWVEEEGEVFRKGQVLLGPEEMEGEYAGEELRKELLEAMVERAPPRPITDEFGLEIPDNGRFGEDQEDDDTVTPLVTSPVLPTSPTLFTSNASPHGSPQVAETKPPPRPYIPRRSSNSSLLGVLSPTVPGGSTSPLGGSPRIPAPPSPQIAVQHAALDTATLYSPSALSSQGLSPISPMLGPSLSRNRTPSVASGPSSGSGQ
ncbi:RNI-like protein [Pluteus cervinus]|uniref:RNI-like protein n=1 Tax=Pluteus cervinus TaxID=181527 RepID=A0ACD3AJT5_9AGAR|nr:RNI-like protein [Pluteus cervinus]